MKNDKTVFFASIFARTTTYTFGCSDAWSRAIEVVNEAGKFQFWYTEISSLFNNPFPPHGDAKVG